MLTTSVVYRLQPGEEGCGLVKQIFTSKNYLCLFSRAITYFMHAFKGFRVSRLIFDGDELHLKISPKGVLNSQMSSAQPSKRNGSSWIAYTAQWG